MKEVNKPILLILTIIIVGLKKKELLHLLA